MAGPQLDVSESISHHAPGGNEQLKQQHQKCGHILTKLSVSPTFPPSFSLKHHRDICAVAISNQLLLPFNFPIESYISLSSEPWTLLMEAPYERTLLVVTSTSALLLTEVTFRPSDRPEKEKSTNRTVENEVTQSILRFSLFQFIIKNILLN